jgi:hypothetical protein
MPSASLKRLMRGLRSSCRSKAKAARSLSSTRGGDPSATIGYDVTDVPGGKFELGKREIHANRDFLTR